MAAVGVAPSKCLLVTGPPGVGKTTLVMRVIESLRSSHPHLTIRGFYTRELREGSERVGFEVVTVDGQQRAPLASSKPSRISAHHGQAKVTHNLFQRAIHVGFKSYGANAASHRWPSVGKYLVDVSSFESIAQPQLQMKEGIDLFVIDEVGKMELFSSSFYPAVLNILESGIPVLASIPIPKFGRDIPGVARLRNDPGATVFTLNTGNRDATKETIYSLLVNLLQKH